MIDRLLNERLNYNFIYKLLISYFLNDKEIFWSF